MTDPFVQLRRVQRLRLLGEAVLVTALFAFGMWVGKLGLDYGPHWDEGHHVRGIRKSAEQFRLLPSLYVYNGMYYNVGYALLLPQLRHDIDPILEEMRATPEERPDNLKSRPKVAALQQRLLAEIVAPEYLLRAREGFLFLSLWVLVFTWLATRTMLPGRPLAAAAAALVVGTSWEVGYHARFVAVDTMLAAFTALTLWASALLATRRDPAQRVWLAVFAGAAAGLAFGCKLTGMLVLAIPALVILLPGEPPAALRAVLQTADVRTALSALRTRVVLLVALLVTFGVVFLLTTPGFAIDPMRFVSDVVFAEARYTKPLVPTYTPTSKDEAHDMIARWLFLTVPSPWQPGAVLLTALGGAGVMSLIWRAPRIAFAVLVWAYVHVRFGLKAEKLIVRNYLPLVPLLAICVGLGLDAVVDRLAPRRAGQMIAAALLAMVLATFVANLTWQADKAQKIKDATSASVFDEMLQWVSTHPELAPYYFTPLIAKKLTPDWHCVKQQPPPETAHFVFGPRADARSAGWRANVHDFAAAHFGVHEINPVWYPTWEGRFWSERTSIVNDASSKHLYLNRKAFVWCGRGALAPPDGVPALQLLGPAAQASPEAVPAQPEPPPEDPAAAAP